MSSSLDDFYIPPYIWFRVELAMDRMEQEPPSGPIFFPFKLKKDSRTVDSMLALWFTEGRFNFLANEFPKSWVMPVNCFKDLGKLDIDE